VQAGVDAGGGPGAGDDVALVDEEHVRVEGGGGEALGELVDMSPVRGAAAAVQQSGRAEHEGAAAHGQQRRAPGVRGPDGVEHRGRVLPADQRGRDGDQVDVVQGVQPEGGHDLGGDAHLQRFPRALAADPELDRRDAVIGAVDPEDLAQDAEFERRCALDQHGRDCLQHGLSVAGRILQDKGRSATVGGNWCSKELLP